MGKYKEYKTEYRQVHIYNDLNFSSHLETFLNKCNENGWRILQILQHEPYHINIIYEIKVEIK